ncbi:MAG TPA: PAS domain S-box protein [Bdellovibrionales bacterium]|nr:PAS domain S-box protein [Bdellovibrionales bacterium]
MVKNWFDRIPEKLRPYLVTLLAVSGVMAFKLTFNELANIDSPILMLVTGIAISAWYGGAVQGFLATALSLVFIIWRLGLDPYTDNLPSHIWPARMLMFSVDCVLVTLLCAGLRTSRNRLGDTLDELTSTEKSLDRSQMRLQKIFESNMIGLVFSDYSGHMLEANDYFLHLLGINREELELGDLTWQQFTPPEDLPRGLQTLRDLREGRSSPTFEKAYIRKDGTRISVLVGAARIDDESLVAFVVDLSERKRAEQALHDANERLEERVLERTRQVRQSESFLDSVIENIPNMIFVKDAKDLRFVRFNRAGEQLIGQNRSQMLGKSDYDFFPKDQADFFTAKDRAVLESKNLLDIPEEPIRTPNGLRFLHTRKIPIFDSNGVAQYLLGISEDISEKKLGEEQRLELFKLQAARDEAEKTASRLEFLAEQAEEASRAKSAFLANISHEIRTPLGAMLGFAELGVEDADLTEEQRESFSTILRNGRQLLALVDDVLDLSKAEAGHIRIDKSVFSLPHFMSEISNLFKLKAIEKGLDFQIATKGVLPERVIGDPIRIRQILLNLIGNAIKFTPNGSVSVIADFVQKEENVGILSFLVRDTGIGIGSDQAQRLFAPFIQVDDSMTRKFGGTGLGLFLSRRLARLMGGDVVLASSELGKGSDFRATVEVEEIATKTIPPSADHQVMSTERAPAPGARVLVVDDSPDNRALVKAFLGKIGVEADVAADGSDAVTKAMSEHYDIVFMDLQMPIMDGFKAVKILRDKGYRRPIVALTAHAMKGDRERVMESGFDNYLAKPVTKQSLADCLANYVQLTEA